MNQKADKKQIALIVSAAGAGALLAIGNIVRSFGVQDSDDTLLQLGWAILALGAAVACAALAYAVSLHYKLKQSGKLPASHEKNHRMFLALSLIFGAIGGNNFYMGQVARGCVKIAILILTFMFLRFGASHQLDKSVTDFVVNAVKTLLGIWVICEVITTKYAWQTGSETKLFKIIVAVLLSFVAGLGLLAFLADVLHFFATGQFVYSG